MPSKVSKNKKPLEIEKIEEPDNKMNKQQQREKLKLELALLNNESEESSDENPIIERVKELKDSPLDTQGYARTNAKRERTEKQKEQFQRALEVKKLNAERRKEEQRLKEEQEKEELEKRLYLKQSV